eukprot:jgi/Mesen1/8368/ME000464S07768
MALSHQVWHSHALFAINLPLLSARSATHHFVPFCVRRRHKLRPPAQVHFSKSPCKVAAMSSATKNTSSKWTSVTRRVPAREGNRLEDIDTPALAIDLDVLRKNMRQMVELLRPYPQVQIRPHAKAHKCAEIALLQCILIHDFAADIGMAHVQMEHSGTVGMCCQKLSEAEAMVQGGIQDVLITNEVVTPGKVARVAQLARQARVGICVDDASNAEALSRASQAAGEAARHRHLATLPRSGLRVLVDVNVGQNRCGVDTPQSAVDLAHHVALLPGLTFDGIQAYHGGIQHVREHRERAQRAAEVASKARAVVDALAEAGLPCCTVTGGGTGTFLFEAASGVYTEVQPGSYIFGDVDYSKNRDSDGNTSAWEQSLFVISTVMSRNVDRAVVVADAGMKAVSFDSGPPVVHGALKEHVECSSGGDEHCILAFKHKQKGDASEARALMPSIGTVLHLVPGHCDPTVNLYDFVVGLEGSTVKHVWGIGGRGPGS